MLNKIKKGFNVPNLIGLFGFFYFVFPGLEKLFLKHLGQILGSNSWQAISAVVVAVTAIFIYRQTEATKKSAKYLEYQTRPIAWLFLMSKKTSGFSEDNLIVKNESSFKILFYYKIKFCLDNTEKTFPNNDPWEGPLHAYPTLFNNYPSIIRLDPKLVEAARSQDLMVRADIWYGLAPDFLHEIQEKNPETWRFDPKREIWIGPNGIEDGGFISLWPNKKLFL